MIKKTLKYHDFEGDLREDDFYFSLNQVQFARINRLFPNGLEKYMQKIIKDKDADELFRVIDILVSEAYGERQGANFVKVAPNGQKLSDFFTNTEAYDNLLEELMKDDTTLINFLTGCLNSDAQKKVRAEMEKQQTETEKEQANGMPGVPKLA